MSTDTGNKLIAEFMNSDSLPRRYDCYWDWLMPVVEKIASMGHDVSMDIEDGVFWCFIHGLRKNDFEPQFAQQGNPKSLIEAVYTAVIQFITWYNTNPQNS